jgi:hypothetical protein
MKTRAHCRFVDEELASSSPFFRLYSRAPWLSKHRQWQFLLPCQGQFLQSR